MADDSGTTSGEELRLEPVQVGSPSRRRALWGVLAVVAVVAGGLVIASGGEDGASPRLPVALGASGFSATAGAPAADMALAWVTYVAGEGLPDLGGEGTAYRLAGTVDETRVRDIAEALGLDAAPTHEDGYWHVASDGAVLEVYEAGGSWWFSATAGEVVEPDAAVRDSSGGSGSSGSGSSSSAGGTASANPACEPGPATDCTFVDVGEPVPDTTAPCAPDGASCTVLTAIDCGAPQVDCTAPPPLEPTPPADLPTEDAARQIALDLLAATGMDVDDAKVTVDGPYDAWYVTVEPKIDGVAVSGWGASVGVGSEGAVTSASGVVGTPERVGDYPLLDTRAAIDRLNEQQGQFGEPMPAIATDAVTSEVNVATADAVGDAQPQPTTTIVESCKVQPDGSEVCEGSGSSSGGSAGSDPGACYEAVPPVGDEGATETTVVVPECVLIDPPVPMPEPVPTEVVLTGAERVLVLLGAVDGSTDVYLVPGYRFSNEDGTIVEVAAVADDSLAPTTIPETTIPETTIPERTETTEVTEITEPPVTTCETLVEDDGSGTTHTIQTCPPSSGDPAVVDPAPSG